jgi:hypothetical protein
MFQLALSHFRRHFITEMQQAGTGSFQPLWSVHLSEPLQIGFAAGRAVKPPQA